MKNFTLALKLLAPAFLIVSGMHLVLGLQAEHLLGASISDRALSDAVLDSQNRFYGVSFGLYGALFYLCGTNLKKYQTVLLLLLAFFFAGGLARLVSIIAVGLPSDFVVLLLIIELVLPVLLFLWWKTIQSKY